MKTQPPVTVLEPVKVTCSSAMPAVAEGDALHERVHTVTVAVMLSAGVPYPLVTRTQ